MLLLKSRLDDFERSRSLLVPIDTFAPEPFEVVKSFQVVVRPVEDEFIATFFDANLSAAGATPEEAVYNLKDVILATFDALTDHKEEELGPGPARQIRVLQQFLQRTA